MKVDGPFYATVENAAAEAARMRGIGYDGVYSMEGNADPFFPLVIAAEREPGLEIATAIAVSFPRNPLHLAYQAWDLHKLSKGHFYLGLGSQVKTHIEKRFGCEFSPPAPRMREQILAIKACFDCFQHGKPLDFRGKYYRHTLMTPMFNAGPNPYGIPPILLGAVGPAMTAVAGEVADGLILHPFHNLAFLRQQQLPSLESALLRSGRSREQFILSAAAICVTGTSEQQFEAALASVKGLLAFYGSTPAYRGPMEAIGRADLQPVLNRLSKEGRWDKMADHIDDEFLREFAVVGEPAAVAAGLRQKYQGIADRLGLYAPYQCADSAWRDIVTALKVPA